MWIKLAVGAVVGLGLGHFFAPGYAFWVVLGVIAGYLADVWVNKRQKQRDEAKPNAG